MVTTRLLERIRFRERTPHLREDSDAALVIDSLLHHLTRILNTRRGNVEISEDYGIPDYTEFLQNFPESMHEMERAIRQTISQFEPRLKVVRVNYLSQEHNDLAVRFQISAKFIDSTGNTPVFFETQVDSGGKISVKK
jgi:type VI secretion system protein